MTPHADVMISFGPPEYQTSDRQSLAERFENSPSAAVVQTGEDENVVIRKDGKIPPAASQNECDVRPEAPFRDFDFDRPLDHHHRSSAGRQACATSRDIASIARRRPSSTGGVLA